MRSAQAAGLALALALPLAARGDDLGRKVFTQTAQPPCALCHTLQAAGAEGTIGPSLDELKPDTERIVPYIPHIAGRICP